MENQILLGYLLVWCLFINLIIKQIRLLLIRFSNKEKLLSKNILISILIITTINFLAPIIDFIIDSLKYCGFCPYHYHGLSYLILITLVNGEKNILFGLVKGFLVAYVIVVPITIIIKGKKLKTKEPGPV